MSGGEFFTPTPPPVEHRCALPRARGTHSHWRCECGKAYRWQPLGAHDRGVDSREPDWQWVRASEFDQHPNPSRRGG